MKHSFRIFESETKYLKYLKYLKYSVNHPVQSSAFESDTVKSRACRSFWILHRINTKGMFVIAYENICQYVKIYKNLKKFANMVIWLEFGFIPAHTRLSSKFCQWQGTDMRIHFSSAWVHDRWRGMKFYCRLRFCYAIGGRRLQFCYAILRFLAATCEQDRCVEGCC